MTATSATQPGRPTLLVSPATGRALVDVGGAYATANGLERYPIRGGIADLVADDLLDDEARREMDSFATNPTIGACYFRRSVFTRAIGALRRALGPVERELRFAELGGGAGYLSGHVAEAFASREVYVCDLSRQYLELAPAALHRVCCDVRLPVFGSGTMDAAALWVTLHHFSPADAARVLHQAYQALRPGGVLMVFEPNRRFFPRRVLMGMSSLRRRVYFDSAERHLDLKECRAAAAEAGFQEVCTQFVNPPYAWEFVRRLGSGPAFFPATELLHLCDRVGVSAVLDGLTRLVGGRGLWGLYFLTLFRKPPGLEGC